MSPNFLHLLRGHGQIESEVSTCATFALGSDWAGPVLSKHQQQASEIQFVVSAVQGRRLFDLLRSGDTLVVRWVDRVGRNYQDICDTLREFIRRGAVKDVLKRP